jgi:hypothetical protein
MHGPCVIERRSNRGSPQRKGRGNHRGEFWIRSWGTRAFAAEGAREARQRGLDYRQNSVSNWMRGVHAAPRELPTLVEELYELSTQEWIELALAFAYGQRIKRRDLQDLHDLRTRYKHFFIEEEGRSYAAKRLED